MSGSTFRENETEHLFPRRFGVRHFPKSSFDIIMFVVWNDLPGERDGLFADPDHRREEGNDWAEGQFCCDPKFDRTNAYCLALDANVDLRDIH